MKTLRKLLATSLIIALTISMHSNAAEVDAKNAWEGNWEYRTAESESGVPLGDLSVHLHVHNGKVIGEYCYIWNFGRKIDCPDENENNIHGKVSRDSQSADVQIHSTYSNSNFRATLHQQGESLRLLIVSRPKSERFFGMNDVILNRRVK